MRRIIGIVVSMLALWVGGHTVVIVIDGLTDDTEVSDAAVILGSKVNPDGKPHPRLQVRLDKGLELYRSGKVKYLIVSGARGVEGFNEALVMRDFYLSQGVSADSILTDTLGINTYHTALHSKEIMARKGLTSLTVISHYFHISRCKLACRKVGIKEVYGVHANSKWEWRDLYSLMREFPAYYSYMVKL